MDSYEFDKYSCNIDTLQETLDKYGVAIIPNILNSSECEKMVSGLWDYFEHITQKWENPINRENSLSWRGIYDLFPMHSMLLQHFNVGHSQVVWDIRQNEKIITPFEKLWNCSKDELLVSFDGLSFSMPPEETNRGWFRNTWYHSDQSFSRNNFECIQSWVTALDIEPGDATLAFYERSHKYHGEFAKKFNITGKTDWYKLSQDEEQFYIEKGCLEKKISCPKGSMVFWDSRTIHCGTTVTKGRENPKHRAVIYLCYRPRKFSTSDKLIKKQKAFNELRMTTHWPCKVILFPKNPRTYGKPILETVQIPPPNLTNIGKKLAGF
jgi:ectoine hydroxylase-related dioxygenase (phytanoyl-CoA dioxygenase family)